MRRWFAAVAAASAAALLTVPTVPASANGVTIDHIASNLDSPRGLAFLPNGTLVVSEAGHGGDVCMELGGAPFCFGLTSQVSTVDLATGDHAPLVSGLFSVLDPEGGSLGVDDLAVQGGRLLGIVGVYPQFFKDFDCTGLASDCPQVLAAARSQAGALLKFTPSGAFKAIANPGAVGYEYTRANPGGETYGTEVDANPYGLLALPRGTYVADAGANTLDWVANNGKVSILHRFPVPDPAIPFPADAVPTCVAPFGHDLIVADLAGRIWRVDGGSATQISEPQPNGAKPHYTGCAADGHGNVYVVSMFDGLFPNPGTGSLTKVAANGSIAPVIGAGGLLFPNKIAVGPDGALYVTTGSVCTNVPDPNACALPDPPGGYLTGGIIKITL